MTSVSLPPSIAALAAGAMGPDDVIALRRHYWADNLIGLREGEELFEIARRLGEAGCPEWHAFFAEAISELLVNQVKPEGYLSQENAEWLIRQIGADGRLLLRTEFETLLKVMDRARDVPDTLAAFALQAVREVVLTGEGVSITGERHEPGRVTRADVEALRRVLFAASSEGFGAVSRAEAEVLFDIAEATAGADNDPSFDDLFARAVANHVLGGMGWRAPSRDEALRREAWLDDSRPLGTGIAAFLGRALGGAGEGWSSTGILDTLFGSSDDACAERNRVAAAERRAAERVTDEEADWIAARIDRDRMLSSAERALLAFLKEQSGWVSPSLRPLLEDAA